MTQLKPLTTTPSRTFRSTSASHPVDILILGAGWTSQFLFPLLEERCITYAATTRTGHDDTIPFRFDPDSSSRAPYERLPPATIVLITFPLKGEGQSQRLTLLYEESHQHIGGRCRYIQLGSTGIFTGKGWNDSESAYDKSNARAVAEDELLRLCGKRACVLDLAGLYGGERQPRNWVGRVARSKEEVRGKGALHLVHGRDVARGVLGVCERWEGVSRRRWIVNDLRVYDWWELVLGWGRGAREGVAGSGEMGESGKDVGEKGGEGKEGLQYEKWIMELMEEEGVRALPRDTDRLGRVLDGRGFWNAVGAAPAEGRVS